jgi:hypothetical protein
LFCCFFLELLFFVSAEQKNSKITASFLLAVKERVERTKKRTEKNRKEQKRTEKNRTEKNRKEELEVTTQNCRTNLELN